MSQDLDLNLGNLVSVEGSRKTRHRVARGLGSGWGKTAGRGGKGQTARAGKGRPRNFEGGQTPLARRLPKWGFKSPNKAFYEVVNVGILDNHFESGSTVDSEQLAEKGLIRKASSSLKVLGEGNLSKKLVVKAHKFSKSAVQKINSAGGKAEELKLPEPQQEKA
ncbi:MAG: 50S ribosomal protein L15 [Proteobacteria bacterium]|nr:50S ribosomal protein L15 [Pseudomonadota bacterium]NDC25754.1 50S ribosomal protein L15 [Pseudomonadota bacterium]NDD05565.1 50S ribosomal protein L15 [Pseudomonadota bacterium]NDG28066.1 50S ribosomal protein L15 [Pseudomonadota bacterium]